MACTSCGREMKIAARGLCSACYMRLRLNGTTERRNAVNKGKICSFEGCNQPAVAKGLCGTHYLRADHPLKTVWKLIRSRSAPSGYPVSWDRFDAFLADVGERPGPKHQLRRLDPHAPYSKENVRWLAPVYSGNSNNWSVEKRSDYARAWNFKRQFGLTVEGYDSLLASQGGVCAVCGNVETHTYKSGKVKSLSVDHDHSTGKVRGLLCMSCNRGLGYLKDDVETLRRAIAYLERHREHEEAA